MTPYSQDAPHVRPQPRVLCSLIAPLATAVALLCLPQHALPQGYRLGDCPTASAHLDADNVARPLAVHHLHAPITPITCGSFILFSKQRHAWHYAFLPRRAKPGSPLTSIPLCLACRKPPPPPHPPYTPTPPPTSNRSLACLIGRPSRPTMTSPSTTSPAWLRYVGCRPAS